MALEIKTLNVENSKEDATIKLYLNFGWTLKSSQRIYNKDSHLESRGSETYSVTETTDFTKLLFERDSNIPNYAKLCKLESDYTTMQEALPKIFYASPVSIGSIEEFAKHKKPELTPFNKYNITLIFGSIATLFTIIFDFILNVSNGVSVSTTLKYILSNILPVGLIFFGISYILAKPLSAIIKKITLSIALKSPNSKLGKKLEYEYDQAQIGYNLGMKKYNNYLEHKEQLEQILGEARSLIS